MAAAPPRARRVSRPRRRGRQQPTRCRKCNAQIVWLLRGASWWRYDPRPVDPRTHAGPPANPVEGKRAWPLGALVEELMGRRECTEAEAREEALDMPWYQLHTCGRTTTT